MGLRVGAGASDLTGPGSGMTMASLMQAAQTPVSKAPIKTVTPNRAPASDKPDPFQAAQSKPDPFELSGASQGGAAQGGATPAPHPNGPPDESFGEKAMALGKATVKSGLELAAIQIGGPIGPTVLRHGEAAGAIAGDAVGAYVGGPGGAIVGGGFGAALGQKLERFVKDEPQPTGMDSLKTAGTMAALGAAGNYVLSPLVKMGAGKIAGMGQAVYDATSPAIESASQTVRNSAKDLLNYVGDKFPVFKHEMIAGTPGAASAEGELSSLSKNGTVDQKQQLWSVMKQRADAIFHNLTVLHDILPKPANPVQEDITNFVPNWIERHGQQVGMYKQQISDLIGDQKADVSGFLDGIGAHLRKNLVIDENGNLLKSASGDQKFLYNFYTDMMKLTKQPPPAKSGFDSAWDLISQQEWKGAVAETPVSTVDFQEATKASPRSISLDDFNTLMRRVQKETVEQGGEMLPMISKDMTNRYYGMMANMAQKAGRSDVAAGLMKANQEYSSLIDFAGDLTRQIQKNPSAAVSTMVNAKNPSNTAMMMRMLSPDQQKTLSRAFISDAVQGAFDRGTSTINAGDVLKQVTSVGDANLRILFGGETKNVVGGLQRLAALQKTNLSYGAQEKLLNDVAEQASKSSLFKKVLQNASDWFGGKPEVADVLGSPEFADKVYRMESGFKSAAQKRFQAIGDKVGGTAPIAAKAPLAVGSGGASILDEQKARRQMLNDMAK